MKQIDELAKRDKVLLYAIRDTKISRHNGKKTIFRKIPHGTNIIAQFSSPTDGQNVIIYIWSAFDLKKNLPTDYYWVEPKDFNWDLCEPVEA